MAAQTGGLIGGCCGIILETLCINYATFNKICGPCENAVATCCPACDCGWKAAQSRPSRRSRHKHAQGDDSGQYEDGQVHGQNGEHAHGASVAPPPAYEQQQPSPTPQMAVVQPREEQTQATSVDR